ncbi:Aerobic respiration control sensor protein ArcB [Stutzerimonas stutzeri]|uniref:hybrid sensor histidine kinase/response regulator n=1 Tax=Stutzerimonas stutzeri TaxID=316 RepID=UPI001644E87A|nr:ATP-binding protein [Stutzerimonas stutzeri]CAD2260607.1 Aerobic respiration control sensor protein ArcB [Stutzerimonas stutzeri]
MSSKHGLRKWIWRAFVQSALVPLVLVEMVLIAVYLLTNSAIRDAQVEYLRQSAVEDLKVSAKQEALVVAEQLTQVRELTEIYRNLTAGVLLDGQVPPLPDLALSSSGVRYTPVNHGGAAVFYANSTPAERQDLQKVARLTALEPLMKQIEVNNPLVASLYFNSWDSLNHIYPWFLTPEQYPHDMVIPDYNFYYLADASNNPERKVVWTDVYVDPAGHGWMMSAIAPVYRDDFLEGVVGLDITVGGILEQIGRLQVPWGGYAMLVGKDLNILALPQPGEVDFGLDELIEHSYEDAIRREILKPDDYRLDRHEQTAALARAIDAKSSGVESLVLDGRPHLVAWSTIDATGWRLLTVVDEADVFSQTNALANRYQQIGYLLIAGLVLFYLLFFAYIWVRARRLSLRLLSPIAGISRMMDQIGQGNWLPARVTSDIRELDQMAGHASLLGSQLERSEAQRLRTLERLELVLESATESLWEIDYEVKMAKLRGPFRQRFGLPTDIISMDYFYERVHPDDIVQIREAHARMADGSDDSYSGEFRFADRNGEFHWLLSRGRVLERDPATGYAKLAAGTHVDIDKLKRIETELRQAMLEAQMANQAKSRFISSMSHELRTPLNAIQGFAQLMRMKQEAQPDDNADFLDEILRASRHLNQLVGDILDWSGTQLQSTSVELQTVDVNRLMQESAELVRAEIAERGLQFNVDLPQQTLQVHADPRRLRQVLLNLLSNAIKYNKPAGQVTLSYQASAGYIRLLVEDTGLGIARDKQGKVFEPFQRLGHENSMIQGTGIGLALCQELASLMRGRMGLHSEPGIGSSFWIELPLLGKNVPRDAIKQDGLPRIFYVEDNPASQFLVRTALADVAAVEVASSGAVALQQILANPPDLVLLDLKLPEMSGEELLARLRRTPHVQGVPVVVLSAVTGRDALRAASLDCQGLLSKPLDMQELRRLVAALLSEVSQNVV